MDRPLRGNGCEIGLSIEVEICRDPTVAFGQAGDLISWLQFSRSAIYRRAGNDIAESRIIEISDSERAGPWRLCRLEPPRTIDEQAGGGNKVDETVAVHVGRLQRPRSGWKRELLYLVFASELVPIKNADPIPVGDRQVDRFC